MSEPSAERESTLEQVVASGVEPDTSGGAGAASGAERGRSPSGAEDAALAPPAASLAPGDTSLPAAAPPDAGSPVRAAPSCDFPSRAGLRIFYALHP